MATLDPGSLLKFLLTGEYGVVLLQVIDILPVDLDFKEFWPKQGFRIKLSDGRHSTYVSLTDEQEELVLTAKLQVGQFIYVNKIVPGTPVPYIEGPHPTPGCRPLVGTPEDLSNLMSEPNLAKGKSNNLRRSSNGTAEDLSNLMSEPHLAEGKSNNLEWSSNVSLPGGNVRNRTLSDRDPSLSSYIYKISVKKEKIPRPPRLNHRRAAVFPVANLKAKSSTCTLRKPSIPSPDVAVNSSPVADGNALPKSLPGKLGTLGKEALQRRDAALVAASIAHQEASAMGALVEILKKFAELCSGADPKAPDTAVEQFLDLHHKITQALTVMEALIKTATSDKIQAFEDKEKMPNSSNTDRSFLHEIGCNSTFQDSQLKLSKTWPRKSSQDLFGSSKAGFLSASSQAHLPSKRTFGQSSCSKRLPRRNSLSLGTDNSPIPKKNSNPNYSSSRQSPTRFTNQDNEKKDSNPAYRQPAHAQDSKRNNCFYQMARLAKQMKNEIESWFIEFIEKTLDTCFKYKKSFEESRAKIMDLNRIRASVSSKKMLLTALIDWVETESQSNGRNKEGLSSYPRMHKVLSRLKLKAKQC